MTKPLNVERSIWINAPRERVWQAITTTDGLHSWWGHDYWEITALEVGALIKFGKADDPILAAVEVVDPPHQFTIKWPVILPHNTIPKFTTYLLTEEKDGTRVTVTETGFEVLPDEVRQTRFDRTAQGYNTVLSSLKTYLEMGA
ncbi:MAG: SRPBCC domain-containing protein [Anaerolineae bacterium]